MPSLGKVFGGWKFLLKWLFLLGQARGKILTLDNLRRNIYIVNRCCMCKNSWESVGHLLLHCSYAYNLWTFVFSLFGVSWVMLKQVVDLLACWNRGVGGRCWAAVIWEQFPNASCELFCENRILKTFNGEEHSIIELKRFFLLTIWLDECNEQSLYPLLLGIFRFLIFYLMKCSSKFKINTVIPITKEIQRSVGYYRRYLDILSEAWTKWF